jgi:hypothetical protein
MSLQFSNNPGVTRPLEDARVRSLEADQVTKPPELVRQQVDSVSGGDTTKRVVHKVRVARRPTIRLAPSLVRRFGRGSLPKMTDKFSDRTLRLPQAEFHTQRVETFSSGINECELIRHPLGSRQLGNRPGNRFRVLILHVCH